MIEPSFLKQIYLFEEIPEPALAELAGIMQERKYEEGDVIFYEGDTTTDLYLLVKGEVELQIKIAPQLAESTVLTVKPAEAFGEMTFMSPKARSASARCTKRSIVAVLARSDFDRLVEQNPSTGLFFFRNVSQLLCEKLRMMNTNLKQTLIRSLGIEI